MSDLQEMAEERKRSDVSLMNFMQNNRVSVVYVGESRRWIAKSTDSLQEGRGTNIRSAIIDLERRMKYVASQRNND
jgi:predicted membrane GTPase involved in stress response